MQGCDVTHAASHSGYCSGRLATILFPSYSCIVYRTDTSGKDIYEVIKMLEEVFNLLNICNHSNNVVTDFIKIIHSIYDDVPDIQIISLPSITAGIKHSRIFASFISLI